MVLFDCPTTRTTSLTTSLNAYRVAYSAATRKSYESSWGHASIFHTVPSANTLVQWVDENAFASIVQARPCPTFGRPVCPWNRSLDYGPVLLLKPFRLHLAMDALPSGCCLQQRINLGISLGCIRCFQFRARLEFTLFILPGQRGITPAFGYNAPHPGVRGTLTLLIHALPSAHYGLG
jgi:hypothetical protein